MSTELRSALRRARADALYGLLTGPDPDGWVASGRLELSRVWSSSMLSRAAPRGEVAPEDFGDITLRPILTEAA